MDGEDQIYMRLGLPDQETRGQTRMVRIWINDEQEHTRDDNEDDIDRCQHRGWTNLERGIANTWWTIE
jgi:hypothetical protein